MPGTEQLLLFMAASLALNFTPGPDMLYVAARSTSDGRSAGIVSALGIAVGCLVHLAALAAGFSILLSRVPMAYDAIRFAGAFYLVCLGARAIARPRQLATGASTSTASPSAVFWQGVFTNVLNPKVALFFLAFLPQFVDGKRGSAVAQLLVLGLLFNLSGTIVNVGVALGASHATAWLRARGALAVALYRLTGAVLVALGLRLALGRIR